MLKRKIEQLETSIVKLQAHTEKDTCPRDLHYVAKANIAPDKEFKMEINSTKKEAELKFIGALTKFHNRHVELNNDKLRIMKSNKSRSKKTLIGLSIMLRAQSNSRTKLMFYTLGPLKWKSYIDVIFSMWNVDKKETGEFIVLANSRHPTMKFTAEISDKK